MHAAQYQEEPARRVDTTCVVIASGDAPRLERLAGRLEGAGYHVVALENGAALLQYLYNSVVHEERPDLVVCDAELDGVDGAQVCIISRTQNPVLPFIVIARPGHAGAFDSLELSEEAVVVPADVDLDELEAEVNRLAGDP